jgi:hypothetical protein
MADQTDDQPRVLDGDDAAYIVASVVAPKVRWANEYHRRVVSTSRRFGWATLVLAMVAIAAFGVASPLWPVVACVKAALAVTRLVADWRVARSARGRRSLATIEQSLHRWLTTTLLSRQNRIDILDFCDLTTDAVLLKSVGPFDRRLPTSARLPSARTLARIIVVDGDWQPHLPAMLTLRPKEV